LCFIVKLCILGKEFGSFLFWLLKLRISHWSCSWSHSPCSQHCYMDVAASSFSIGTLWLCRTWQTLLELLYVLVKATISFSIISAHLTSSGALSTSYPRFCLNRSSLTFNKEFSILYIKVSIRIRLLEIQINLFHFKLASSWADTVIDLEIFEISNY